MPATHPLTLLEDLYGKDNYRFDGFKKLLSLIQRRNLKVIVESNPKHMGWAQYCRNDGCSTYLLSKWSTEMPLLTIFSVHSDRIQAQLTKTALAPFVNTHIYHYDPAKFASTFPVPIDVLILNDFGDFQTGSFRMMGELLSAYPKLHRQSVIMLSECLGPVCAATKMFLEVKGWVYELEGALTVMTMGNSIAEIISFGIPEVKEAWADWKRSDLQVYEGLLSKIHKSLISLDARINGLDELINNEEVRKELGERAKQLEIESDAYEMGWEVIVEDFGIPFPRPKKFIPDDEEQKDKENN